MKENSPNLAKEIENFSSARKSRKLSPKEVGPKEALTKAHHNYISQDKREGENLKIIKRKEDSYLQRSSHTAIS